MEFYRYKLDKAIITNDLSKERPQWILSSYGPGRDAPLQLFGGHPREQSFEELRFRHYELTAQKNQQLAIQEAQALVTNAEQQIQAALNDVEGAIKYIINGETEHPNRIDICKARGSLFNQAQAQMPTSSLKAPSTFGRAASPALGFGQTSTVRRPSAPTFGQPSAPAPTFGQISKPAFSQPAFGRPATLGESTSRFGEPTQTFGKSSVPTSTFGESSAPTPFASSQPQPSPFGAPNGASVGMQPSAASSQPSNPFGPPSAPTQPIAFDKPQASFPSPVGSSATSIQPGILGKPSGPSYTGTFGQLPISADGTRVSAAPANPFDPRPITQTSSLSLQPPTAAPNPFGPPCKQRMFYANSPVPPFGVELSVMLSANNKADKSVATAPTAPTMNGSAGASSAASSANGLQVQKDAQGKVGRWGGKPVTYIDDEPCFQGEAGNWQKIWNPDGPPVFTKTMDLRESIYDEATMQKYKFMNEHGFFKDGTMPELAPRREWCTWNF